MVDANILIRAVLGTRVRAVLELYGERATFIVPESAYLESIEHLAALVVRRGGDAGKALSLFQALSGLFELIGPDVYGEFEGEARERLGSRDPEDWPAVAAALAFHCPIWTEDADFFG